MSNILHRDCLPILMLLYVMLAHLMLFVALFNAVCLNNAYLFVIYFSKCLMFSCFFLSH